MRLLRYTRRVRSAAKARGGDVRVVDTASSKPNVTIHFELNGAPAEVPLRPRVRDLMDLAATVYIGDELNARSAAPDRWNRDFAITFPTSSPAKWQATTAELVKTLGTLSGDRFSFEWPKTKALGSYGRHRTRLEPGYDVVCLFSGGVDSFLGAYDVLKQGKRVLLVGHQAEGITASAQKKLFQWLRKRFDGRADLLQCRVARSLRSNPKFDLGEKVEDSHRPRSLLFLAIGVVAANATGVDRVWMPENGLIALNPPLGVSRLGTVSTRTAHPGYLNRFIAMCRQLGVFTGQVHNPFLYLSKTDMVAATDRTARAVLAISVSCSHAGGLYWRGAKGIRHCGYCVPCIYRRIAFMEVGLDDRSAYLRDVFSDLRDLTNTERADFRALTRFAKRVVVATDAERQALVVAQGVFPHDIGGVIGSVSSVGYTEWSQMLKRWSENFLKKLADAASRKTKIVLGI
jgi:7-cyano-7-deazaguanine synthase in queuosine biosynthesis